MRIHWLQHVPFEDLGIIEEWAGAKAHNLSATRVYENGAPPAKEEIDFLVIMGGPMSVWEEDKYSWLTREKRFIEDAIRENKTVLGICLGAQLIVDDLGFDGRTRGQRRSPWCAFGAQQVSAAFIPYSLTLQARRKKGGWNLWAQHAGPNQGACKLAHSIRVCQ